MRQLPKQEQQAVGSVTAGLARSEISRNSQCATEARWDITIRGLSGFELLTIVVVTLLTVTLFGRSINILAAPPLPDLELAPVCEILDPPLTCF